MRSLILPLLPLITEAASVSVSSSLTIPIGNVINGDLSSYLDHPLLPKFHNWLSTNEDLGFFAPNATIPPTLKAVYCDDNDNTGCLLESSIDIDPETAKAVAYAQDQEKRSIVTRAVSRNWIAKTHWKTYYAGEFGIEHYTDWDLKCQRINYRSTGYVLLYHDIQVYDDNNVATKMLAYDYRKPGHQVTLQQNYACSWFGNKCCTSYYLATGSGGTLVDWTWECATGYQASACQG